MERLVLQKRRYSFQLYNDYKRWEVLKKHISWLTSKPLTATRWASGVDTLKPLRFQLCDIYDALIEITEDINRNTKSRVKARGLEKNIENYKFICSVIVWYDVLSEINSVPQLFQHLTVNSSDCVRMLSSAIEKVQKYSDSSFHDMGIAADEIAENLDCSTQFLPEDEVRMRMKKTPIYFEINFLNNGLLVTLHSSNGKFTLGTIIASTFSSYMIYRNLKILKISSLKIVVFVFNR